MNFIHATYHKMEYHNRKYFAHCEGNFCFIIVLNKYNDLRENPIVEDYQKIPIIFTNFNLAILKKWDTILYVGVICVPLYL